MGNVKSVLITDLDNTLYNWFHVWYESFSALLNELELTSGIDRSVLIPEIKKVHEMHGTAEYAFLIQEIPSIREKHSDFSEKEIVELYNSSIHAYNSSRKKHLDLYPTVEDTLKSLKNKGVLIVGYTESLAFYTSYRLKKLKLDGVLDFIYSPPDHDMPKHVDIEHLRKYSMDAYELDHTVHRSIPKGEEKPNAKILLQIISEINSTADSCIYIGDSLTKDIKMSQDAGVEDVFAEYGVANRAEEYELLRQVTHWTQEQVDKEKITHKEHLNPSYTLHETFSELFNHFDFVSHDQK